MKNLYLLFFLLIVTYCRGQVISISPNLAVPNQTLTTTITLASGVMTLASPPFQSSDIYLEQNGYRIYTNYFDVNQIYPLNNPGFTHTDSLSTDFTIPLAAPLGWYEVHVISYIFDPLNPVFPGQPVDNILNYGLVVHDPSSCELPSGTSATAITNTSAQINWATITADTFRIRYYISGTLNYLYKDVDGSAGAVSAVLTGLFPGTTYNFEISTICSGIHSTYSIINSFTTLSNPVSCTAPAILNISVVTNSTADISWSSLITANNFLIRYSVDGTTNYMYALNNGTTFSRVLSNLMPATTYQVQVSAICAGVSSGYSSSFIFTTVATPVSCAQPFGLASSAVTNISATISWSANIVSDTFRIRYAVNGSGNYLYKEVNGSLGNSTSLTGLFPATTYMFQVSSKCAGITSAYSPASLFITTSVPVACAVPWGMSFSNTTNTTVTLSWSTYVTADTFRVRYREVGAISYQYASVVGTSNSINLSNLQPNTVYNYQVRSICASGSSAYGSVASFTTLNLPIGCVVPFGVSVSNITNTTSLASWNNLVTADTFRLRYSINGSTNYLYINSPGTSGNSSLISNLLPNTTYHLRVSSICSGVSSGYGATVIFTTSAGSVACTVPFGLASTNITLNSADISWTPLVTADSFLIRYSVFGTTNYIWKKISGAGGISSTQLTGLTNVTNYQWQVRTICNGIPAGPYSVSDFFTTPLVRLANSNRVTENTIRVFPNPASGNIFVSCIVFSDDKGRITMYDLAGRLIQSQEIHCLAGENNFTIPVEAIQPGCYFISVLVGDKHELKRIVVE